MKLSTISVETVSEYIHSLNQADCKLPSCMRICHQICTYTLICLFFSRTHNSVCLYVERRRKQVMHTSVVLCLHMVACHFEIGSVRFESPYFWLDTSFPMTFNLPKCVPLTLFVPLPLWSLPLAPHSAFPLEFRFPPTTIPTSWH